LNIGLHTAWRRALHREAWRQLVTVATFANTLHTPDDADYNDAGVAAAAAECDNNAMQFNIWFGVF